MQERNRIQRGKHRHPGGDGTQQRSKSKGGDACHRRCQRLVQLVRIRGEDLVCLYRSGFTETLVPQSCFGSCHVGIPLGFHKSQRDCTRSGTLASLLPRRGSCRQLTTRKAFFLFTSIGTNPGTSQRGTGCSSRGWQRPKPSASESPKQSTSRTRSCLATCNATEGKGAPD